MNLLRLLSVAGLLLAPVGVMEAAPQEAPLVAAEALEGLPLTTTLDDLDASGTVDQEEVESASMIPEPAGIAIIGGGLIAMIVMRRRLG